jgi:hypothetical protein
MSHEMFRIKYRMFLAQIADLPTSQRPRYERLAIDTLRRFEKRYGTSLIQSGERAA